MVSPFDSDWNSDSFVTADSLNRVTYGNGTEFPATWNPLRLFYRTDEKILYTNTGTEASPSFSSVGGGFAGFGNGTDSELTTLPSDLGTGTNSNGVTTLTGGTITKTGYFKDLIINVGDTINVNKASNDRPTIIFANKSITINGTLFATGFGANGGATVSGGSGGSRGGNTSGSANGGNGGAGAAGNVGTAGHFFSGSGSTGDSGNGSAGGSFGNSGGNCGTVFAGSGGNGGSGTTNNINGSTKISGEVFDDILNVWYALASKTYLFGAGGTSGSGGAGGGGKGGGSNSFFAPVGLCNNYFGSAGGVGGDGGKGGDGGGMIILIAPSITFGVSGKIECNGIDGLDGGDGGSGSNGISRSGQSHNQGDPSGDGGGGVGGSGGNGGFVVMFYKSINNLGTADNRTDNFGVQNNYTVYANVEVNKGGAGSGGTAPAGDADDGLVGNADGRVILHEV